MKVYNTDKFLTYFTYFIREDKLTRCNYVYVYVLSEQV